MAPFGVWKRWRGPKFSGGLVPLSLYRFRLQTKPASAMSTGREGRAFRTIRRLYGLGARDVAVGWALPTSTITALERGRLRLRSPADMQAALSQLWLWAVEKTPGIAR
jgi:hypothetical protein